MNIPKNEQIKAILSCKEWSLAKEYGLCDPSEIKWTVSKQDVRHFFDENGLSVGWVDFKKSTCDGLYVLRDGNEWTVYFQERGVVQYEDRFTTESQAIDFLLENYYLKRFGIS
jgi:hypothetical protein